MGANAHVASSSGEGMSCAQPAFAEQVATLQRRPHPSRVAACAGLSDAWRWLGGVPTPGLRAGRRWTSSPDLEGRRGREIKKRSHRKSPSSDPPSGGDSGDGGSGERRKARAPRRERRRCKRRERRESNTRAKRGLQEQHACQVPPFPQVAALVAFRLDLSDKVVLCEEDRVHPMVATRRAQRLQMRGVVRRQPS